MMNITEQEFCFYVSSATSPTGYGIFDMIQAEIEFATKYLDFQLDGFLETISEAADDEDARLHEASIHAKRFICLFAYERGIPHLDLVLTPTGFGVVSNQNVAPASAERVERLLRATRLAKEQSLDALIESLRGVEAWYSTLNSTAWIHSLVWKGEQVRQLGFPGECRSKLEEMSGKIAEAERQLIHLVSPEFHGEMLEAIRRKEERDSPIGGAVRLATDFICGLIYAPGKRQKFDSDYLLAYLDKYIDNFPTYRNSSAYEANHFNSYQNAKDDSCFFFG